MSSNVSPLRSMVRAGKRRWHLAHEFYLDFQRYRASSAPVDDAVTDALRGVNLEAQLTKDYHRVEKGLSLRAPKQPFGSAVEARLATLIPVATRSEPADYVRYAEDAKDALADWNVGGLVSDTVSPVRVTTESSLTPEQLRAFITSRHSIRDFDENRMVSRTTVEQAVVLASHTPSVCNRQAGRVHAFYGGTESQAVLRLQNGNRGFRDHVQNVLVVTVERGLFAGAAERNQRWIDGGLFAMTLVWALHGLEVSTCMLNWSMTNAQTDKLRATAGIPDSEDVVCMIAIGYLPAGGVRVARSARRPLGQILKNT